MERITVGDFVIAPFYDCDMSCVNCLNGVSTSCLNGGWWGADDRIGAFADGAQGELVRVPHADGSLVATPSHPDDSQVPGLLTLADVMGTGHHAAVSAGVGSGSTVVVVGDGAVGLCAVLASRRLGASRIVAMSRHADRQALAREFGATDIVEERGDAGVARIKELFDGIGADCVLECVGTKESMDQAIRSARPGGMVGYVGAPNGGPELPIRPLFNRNVGVNGGVAPVRNYIEELLPEVWAGDINPGRVFDLELPLSRGRRGLRRHGRAPRHQGAAAAVDGRSVGRAARPRIETRIAGLERRCAPTRPTARLVARLLTDGALRRVRRDARGRLDDVASSSCRAPRRTSTAGTRRPAPRRCSPSAGRRASRPAARAPSPTPGSA